MIRNIYVGENYSRKVVTPLITTDQNSYKIIWDTMCKNGVFKITAIKADNSAVFDFGELSAEGVATYVVANNMYDTEGPLKLFLAIAEQDSITTCREINLTVKEGADEASLAENNVNPINNLAMQVLANSNENNAKIQNLKNYGVTDVYILKEGEDIIVSENIVTGFLKHSYSQYEAIAFPEGITEINLPDTNLGGDTPLTANKIIMPKSLKSIGRFSFANHARWDAEDNLIDSSIVVDVKEYVLNEGLEIIDNYAFADNIYLEKVNIPKSLKKIGRGAFQLCDSLKEVFIPATVTEIGDGNFNSSTYKQEDSTIIYGYAGSVAEYYAKNENFLKNYANTFVNIGSDYSEQLNNKADLVDGTVPVSQLPLDVVQDADYVHTDNNYTTAEKNKLEKLTVENLSNSLKGNISGDVINITDISPVEHNMAVSVRGKNSFNTNAIAEKTEKTVEVDGVSYEVYDINGYTNDFLYTTSSSFQFDVYMKKGKTYTVSLIWMGSKDGGNVAGSLYMPFKDKTGGNQCFDNMGVGSDVFNAFGVMGTAKKPLTKITFTITPTEDIVKGALCYYHYGNSGYVLKDSIQIEEGTTATEYEPYTVKLYKQGKNWFSTNKITKKVETTVEVDGVSYEVYDINGYTNDFLYTTSSSFQFDVYMKKGKTYIVSLIWMGSKDGGNVAGSLYMPFKDKTGGNQCFDNMGVGSDIFNAFGVQGDAKKPLTKITFTIKPTEDIVKGALCYYHYGNSGYVLKDSIQIEEGTTATEYEPGIEPVAYDVSADGTVEGVTSLYPNTTLYTDTDGTVIDCTYNKDINKAFAELQNAIISLGGNV